jgi:hypothetical protein
VPGAIKFYFYGGGDGADFDDMIIGSYEGNGGGGLMPPSENQLKDYLHI